MRQFGPLLLLPLVCLFALESNDHPSLKAYGYQSTQKTVTDLLGVASCQPCHQNIYDSYIRTAHFNTSRLADEKSIKGKVSEGHNILRTSVEGTYFKMERRGKGFYQTGNKRTDSGTKTRTERFDIAIGSGRKGQTYLYWKNNLLFQLPVSYTTGTDEWVNSPGYIDGRVHFDRVIPPRCLECHTTAFKMEGPPPGAKYGSDYVLGISCEKCHGTGLQHVQYHTSNPQETSPKFILSPKSFPRSRKIDNCALCHSGIRQPRQPSFSYTPGENLEKYFMPESDRENLKPDVHGNQVGLLRKSKCFISSPEMSCSTCHNVHKEERNIAELSQKCIQCHQAEDCGIFRNAGKRIVENCIDCHMPDQRSNVINISAGMRSFSPYYRNHAIGIYRTETAKVLKWFRENRK